MSKKYDPLELDYMVPVVAAVKQRAKKFSLVILGIVILLLILFFFWAAFANINEVTRGSGKVISPLKTQIIDNLEGGIIENILVKEGDHVKKEQILMRIDSTIVKARYKGDRKQYLQYIATAERLRAQLDEKIYKVPEIVQIEAPIIAREELLFYFEYMEHIRSKLQSAKTIVEQRQQEILLYQAQVKQKREEKKLAEEELNLVVPMVKKGLLGKRNLIELQRDLSRLNGNIENAKINVIRSQATLRQAQSDLDGQKLSFRNQNLEQLNDIDIKLIQVKSKSEENANRLKRSELRSPVDGIVKEVKVKTIGSVVESGRDLITIVPDEEHLVIEAKIHPSDIAFLSPGLKAKIKVTAYDFSLYGSLPAELIKISADTIFDEEEKKYYYYVLLRANKNFLERAGKKYAIIPGMTVEADIMAGKRTILQYLLKPILRGLNRSLSER